ncbi:DUF697 domain-containing protein [bacterium]|nr:DUF697 domain-containing protein [bacterium]
MIKRLVAFLCCVLSYVLIKELLILHQAAKSFHPMGGWIVLTILALTVIYLVIIPLVRIFFLPARLRPAKDPEDIDRVARIRMQVLRQNKTLKRLDLYPEEFEQNTEGYRAFIAKLKPEADKIRKKYVTQVFYATTIAQNGFLDAVIILSIATAMMRDFFILYQGRVSNRELIKIGRLVYLSMAIGGSEGVETATDEILSKLVATGVKSVPFAARLFGSVADGFVNATLLTRIAMVTEKYCTRLFAESDRAFYPTLHSVVSATKTITSDVIERIAREMKRIAREQTGGAIKAAVNPVKTVLTRAFDRSPAMDDKFFDEEGEFGDNKGGSWNPLKFISGLGRLMH